MGQPRFYKFNTGTHNFTEVQRRIAAELIELHKTRPIKECCYDRAYAGEVIPTLEQAGITCVRIGQGWELSPGCQELDRRLIEQSISIEPNAVMDFCANNAETTKPNAHGDYWPIKPGQTSGKITGRRSQKVDGIVALCNALVRARLHNFPKAQPHVAAMLMDL
jgi:phage terminase large subunit-like protein